MQINSSFNNFQVTRKVQEKMLEILVPHEFAANSETENRTILSMTLLRAVELLCNRVLEMHCITVKQSSVNLFFSMEPSLLKTTSICLVTFNTD